MQTNLTKAKLAEGKVVFGAIIGRYAPDLIELFGALGYDFVMIDCEHGPMDLDQVEHMVRAGEVFGITPIARIPDHSESTILRYLDRGLQGIIVPHVNTKEEAESVARAARYHPEGWASPRLWCGSISIRIHSVGQLSDVGNSHGGGYGGGGKSGRNTFRSRSRRAACGFRGFGSKYGQPRS